MGAVQGCHQCRKPVRTDALVWDESKPDQICCVTCGRVVFERNNTERGSPADITDPARPPRPELTALLSEKRRTPPRSVGVVAPPRSIGQIVETALDIFAICLMWAGLLGCIGCLIAMFFAGGNPFIWMACAVGSRVVAGVGLFMVGGSYGLEGDPLEAMAIWESYQVESGSLPYAESRLRGGNTQHFRVNNDFGSLLRARERARRMFGD